MSGTTFLDRLPDKRVDTFKWVATVGALAIVLWSTLGIDVAWSRLPDAPGRLWTIARLMAEQLSWSQMSDLLPLMWESIAIAWIGTVIATAVALPLSFLAAENLVGRPVAWVTRQVFNVLRAIPELILAIVFLPVFGLGPRTGVIAIGVGSIGSLGKLFYEILEGIHRGPLEAADAVGATRLQRLRWGVIPQVLPELTSFALYRFEINIRASAVLGAVSAGGIGDMLVQGLRFRNWDIAGAALIIVVLGTILVDLISGAIRRRIVAGPSYRRRDAKRSPDVPPETLLIARESGI